MISLFKEERIYYRLISAGVFVSIVFFIGKIVYAGILALPYPKELLEPANIALTNLFIEGKNPYIVSALDWDVPGINYDYPFLSSLVAALIAKITCCNAVTAHFMLSFISILISGIIGFIMVLKQARTTVAPLLASLLFMFCHWRFGYISAAPDDFGLLLFIITMYCAVSERITNKPLVCAVAITSCFYTKQYFVFVAAGIFVYMLLYSKKDAIRLLIWTLGINIVVASVIWIVMPLYYIKSYLFTYLGTVPGGGFKLATFFDQLEYLLVLFAALFVILIVLIGITMGKIIRKKAGIRNFFSIKENDPFALSVIMMIVMFAPLLIIGRNDGAFISYFLQLWMPAIACVTLISFERIIPEKYELSFVAVYFAIAAFTIYFGFGKLPLHILTDEEIADWNKATEYTRVYSEKGDVFYSRSLAYDGFARKNGECLCGHEGEVGVKTLDSLVNLGVPLQYFEYTDELIDQNLQYRKMILNKASEGRYSLIAFELDTGQELFNEDICSDYGYRRIDTLTLQLGNMPYRVAFYAR